MMKILPAEGAFWGALKKNGCRCHGGLRLKCHAVTLLPRTSLQTLSCCVYFAISASHRSTLSNDSLLVMS